jgi:hypothetical protein
VCDDVEKLADFGLEGVMSRGGHFEKRKEWWNRGKLGR